MRVILHAFSALDLFTRRHASAAAARRRHIDFHAEQLAEEQTGHTRRSRWILAR